MLVRRPGTTELRVRPPPPPALLINSGPKRGRTRVHTVKVDVSSPFCELDAFDSTTLRFKSRGGSAVGVAAEMRALNLEACSSMDGADDDDAPRSAVNGLRLVRAGLDLLGTCG
mmetsp:Transcript_19194/g.35327  ORF Transcript_19194/g.35327 Transcript_19194/m.35327 type:complete len:114 (+) Transcript_19194:288-629(+)